MKLWIRSQNRKELMEVENLWVVGKSIHNPNNFNLMEKEKTVYIIVADEKMIGEYKTHERALQVLDEIQNALVGKIVVEPKYPVKQKEEKALKEMVEEKTIVKSQAVDIKTLNQNCVVYELPRE